MASRSGTFFGERGVAGFTHRAFTKAIWQPPTTSFRRGYSRLFIEHVN